MQVELSTPPINLVDKHYSWYIKSSNQKFGLVIQLENLIKNYFMENAATPAATPTETPVVPAATPAVNPTESVTLSKEQHDQLARDAARASSNQRKADLWDRQNKGSHFKPSVPTTPPTSEEIADRAAAEDRKAERGLLALAADPALREVLDADPTLRGLLTSNPLAVLPMFASDALDAEDAISLVKEALVARKKPSTPPATPPTPPVTPPVGGVNPNDEPVNAEVEAARKNPNTERAVAGMIGARLRGFKK